MSLWKEYDTAAADVAEGLLWGGLTLPNVMQQKDGSCFSVIEYAPYEKTRLSKAIKAPNFRRGWGIWSELQHTPEGDRCCLVLFWNPFVEKHSSRIDNILQNDLEVQRENFLPYFAQEAQSLLREIRAVTEARLLEYQDLMDFLSFALSMGEHRALMPEVPLYMDALLSQDIDFDFRANDIFIDSKKVVALTLPTLPETEGIISFVQDIPFRYVRRMLFFDAVEAAKEMKKYAGKWCPMRKTMRERILSGIVSELNGYCYNGFIFHLDSGQEEQFRADVSSFLMEQHLPFLFEEYSLKDTWWGSLPGMFLANITPPLVGLPSLEGLLVHRELAEEAEAKHRFRHLLDAMETDRTEKGADLEYVSDGQISPQERIPQVRPALRQNHS